jgi:hypothetical protein
MRALARLERNPGSHDEEKPGFRASAAAIPASRAVTACDVVHVRRTDSKNR